MLGVAFDVLEVVLGPLLSTNAAIEADAGHRANRAAHHRAGDRAGRAGDATDDRAQRRPGEGRGRFGGEVPARLGGV